MFKIPYLQADPFLPDTTVSAPTPELGQNAKEMTLSPAQYFDGSNNPLVDPANFNFMDLLNKIVAYAFLLVFALSVAFIFWGGITFILSGGQEEKVKTAVNTIRYAIIGLIVAIFSFAVVAWIGRQFDLDIIQYVKPENILTTMKSLFK